jgi:transposase
VAVLPGAAAVLPGAVAVLPGAAPLPTPPGGCDQVPPSEVASDLTSNTASDAASGRRSQSEPFRAKITEGLEQGLTAQRIWQDLRDDYGFTGGYLSVQRFVRLLRESEGPAALPFRRMEVEPGAEAQIDFGKAATLVHADGRRSRPHLFRLVLSHSRKGYSEAVPRQTTELFLRAIENAFWSIGGVPRTLVPDNLKAAVLHADWYDPELNPKILAFCEHYGTVLLPTRPRTPRHKGKVERGVGYAQSNAVRGRTFASLAGQNQFLREWEANVADTRIHGTTRQQVAAAFERERAALLPLPAASVVSSVERAASPASRRASGW